MQAQGRGGARADQGPLPAVAPRVRRGREDTVLGDRWLLEAGPRPRVSDLVTRRQAPAAQHPRCPRRPISTERRRWEKGDPWERETCGGGRELGSKCTGTPWPPYGNESRQVQVVLCKMYSTDLNQHMEDEDKPGTRNSGWNRRVAGSTRVGC